MNDFHLDPALDKDSAPIANLGLCQLRLHDDCRWPWLVMVPQRDGLIEIFDLTPLDLTMLTFETNLVAQALKFATGATKINIGALGNVVRQFHMHVVARFEGDDNWPRPVWGYPGSLPWDEAKKTVFLKKVLDQL